MQQERLIKKNVHILRQKSGIFLQLGELEAAVHRHLRFEENNHPTGHLFLQVLIPAHHHLFLEAFPITSTRHPISVHCVYQCLFYS